MFALLAAGTLLAGCQSEDPPSDAAAGEKTAAEIVGQAVDAHGSDLLRAGVLRFSFRGDRYRLAHNDGRFRYTRAYTDSMGREVTEVLSNDRLYRAVNGTRVELSDQERRSVETTVNSVAYFALLPEPLQDPAVRPSRSGIDTINGRPYHRIRIEFAQQGGGRDWQDVFLYWFDAETHTMDYLAYAYGLGPEEEFGTRFREAYNVRTVNGVRVADYRNYTDTSLVPAGATASPDRIAAAMARYPDLLQQDALERVSTIELKDVTFGDARDE